MSLIQRSFDRAASSYRAAAEVQTRVARTLAEQIDRSECCVALEIGCGDGLFTEQLRKRVKIDRLFCLDIAETPLRQLPAKLKALRVQADAEALPIRLNSVDLLVSSSSLQWLNHPEKSLPEILACLKPGGAFFFSIFCRGTFAEMAAINQRCNFGQVYPLPCEQEFLTLLEKSGATSISMHSETIVRYFPDVISFLHNQKATGAGYSGERVPSGKQAFKRFCSDYHKAYDGVDGIPVSYRIAYYRGVYLPQLLT